MKLNGIETSIDRTIVPSVQRQDRIHEWHHSLKFSQIVMMEPLRNRRMIQNSSGCDDGAAPWIFPPMCFGELGITSRSMRTCRAESRTRDSIGVAGSKAACVLVELFRKFPRNRSTSTTQHSTIVQHTIKHTIIQHTIQHTIHHTSYTQIAVTNEGNNPRYLSDFGMIQLVTWLIWLLVPALSLLNSDFNFLTAS